MPRKKYSVIYADPPWKYRDTRKRRGGATAHYPVMDLESIKDLPVSDIAARDCFLFLWVTFPHLREALDVIEAWGFRYVTLGFSWVKTNKNNGKPFFGIGYYTRSNCEVCLLAVRGKPLKKSNSISSVIISPKERHSKKPDVARTRIVELCGNVPRIELFARECPAGWDVWGNEVENSFEFK